MLFLATVFILTLWIPASTGLGLPRGAWLVLVGFFSSELVTWLGLDTGLRWQSISGMILNVIVPILVFVWAFQIDHRIFRRELKLNLLVSTPLFLLCTVLTAYWLYYTIGFPTHFTLIVAVLTAMILASSDPEAIDGAKAKSKVTSEAESPEATADEKSHQNKAKRKATLRLLENESLINETLAVVAFAVLLDLAAMPMDKFMPLSFAIDLAYTLVLGLLVGALLAAAGVCLLRSLSGTHEQAMLILAIAASAYYLAEIELGASGVLAVFVCGILFGRGYGNYSDNASSKQSDEIGIASPVSTICTLSERSANSLLYLLAGISVTLAMFAEQWLAMVLGIIGVLLARLMVVYGLLVPLAHIMPLTRWRKRSQKEDKQQRPFETPLLAFGGTKGSVALALALSLPFTVPSWYTVQAIVYGVVLFSLFIQAPLVSAWLASSSNSGTELTSTLDEKKP